METKLDAHMCKLNDRNYRTWKTEMRWYLRGKGLLEYILGNVQLSDKASEPEKVLHKLNDDKAIAAIGLHVEADQQIHIEDCLTAQEAWKTLEQVHQPKSRVRILQLKKEFHRLKLREDETMTSFIARAKTIASNLTEAGAAVKDEDLAYVLLAGLPDSYENLNMALASLPDDKFTSAEVKRVLLAEYDRRKCRQEDDIERPMEALQINKKIEQRKMRTSGNDRPKILTCFNCRKTGHIARDCRVRCDRGRKRQESKYKRNYDAFLISVNNIDIEDTWLLDSGCTHHVCKRRDWFTSFREIDSEIINTAADPGKQGGTMLQAKGIGNVTLKTFVGAEERGVILHNVYYVPNIRKNLMSVSQIERKGKELMIKNGRVRIRNEYTKQVVCEAYRRNDLYIVRAEVDKDVHTRVESNNMSLENHEIWHKRFCHTNNEVIQKLANMDKVVGLDNTRIDKYTCDSCCISRATKTPCKRLNIKQTKDVCELIHSDVCGPLPVKSFGGCKYFITFTDDFSRKVDVACMKSKDEAKYHIKRYIARVEREKGKKVKRFRTDNGLEFCNLDLKTYFTSLGIRHEKSNVETPQMNGVAERINRTLMDTTRTILKSTGLPHKFWAEAIMTAAYIKNRICHSAINDEVPLAVWNGRKPSIRHLKVYGCLAYARLPNQGRGKLDDRALECILVGYADQTRGYRLWCPSKHDVITTKHVRFAEDKIGYEWIYRKEIRNGKYENDWSDDDVQLFETNEKTPTNESEKQEATNQDDMIKEHTDEIQKDLCDSEIVGACKKKEIRKKGRPVKKIRNPYGRKGKPRTQEIELLNQTDEDEDSTEQSDIEANFVEIVEPQNVSEALSSPQAMQWKHAIKDELDSLTNRKTWEVTTLPEGRKCIGSRWVFKLKTNAEGDVTRYKARLVAQGFLQQKGINYNETYSPVANFSLIRLLIALAVEFRWYTRHVDIKCAYLYGELNEEIYMKLPPMCREEKGLVVKLLRPIYGLKQSGRNWNQELNDFLIKQDFERLKSSNCVYIKKSWAIIIIVYVDDIFIFARDQTSITNIVKQITKKYEAKDLGEISYALGVKVKWNAEGGVSLSQGAYIDSILKRYNMTECRGAATPLDPGIKTSKDDSPTTQEERRKMSKVPYRELIGSLMYLALSTRPDILFAVTKMSQYNANPGELHWLQAKHILRYLSKTKDLGIIYKKKTGPKIHIYCDADWAGDSDDRHSFSGMVVKIGENTIQWRSSKQKCLSSSTMEAEYVSLSYGVKEAMWLRMFFDELKLTFSVTGIINMYCDNRAAIDFSRNRVEKSKTKHIDIAYHVVREKLDEELFQLIYVPSNDNPSDVLTKGLKRLAHDKCTKEMGLDVTKWGNCGT